MVWNGCAIVMSSIARLSCFSFNICGVYFDIVRSDEELDNNLMSRESVD